MTTTGNVAKPSRMVIGSLIIQQRMGFSDRDLVKQIQENPYYQYFIGLESFQHTPPFAPTLLVEWRKRIDVSFVIKVNDALCDAMPKNQKSKKSFGLQSRGMLVATQVCDATVAPQNIRFPQDTSLLNEARTKLEKMIDWFCSQYGLEKPRMYRKVAHKEYLAFAKSKKPSIDRIKQTIRQQLGYVNRDLRYIDDFIQQGFELDSKYQDIGFIARKGGGAQSPEYSLSDHSCYANLHDKLAKKHIKQPPKSVEQLFRLFPEHGFLLSTCQENTTFIRCVPEE